MQKISLKGDGLHGLGELFWGVLRTRQVLYYQSMRGYEELSANATFLQKGQTDLLLWQQDTRTPGWRTGERWQQLHDMELMQPVILHLNVNLYSNFQPSINFPIAFDFSPCVFHTWWLTGGCLCSPRFFPKISPGDGVENGIKREQRDTDAVSDDKWGKMLKGRAIKAAVYNFCLKQTNLFFTHFFETVAML